MIITSLRPLKFPQCHTHKCRKLVVALQNLGVPLKKFRSRQKSQHYTYFEIFCTHLITRQISHAFTSSTARDFCSEMFCCYYICYYVNMFFYSVNLFLYYRLVFLEISNLVLFGLNLFFIVQLLVQNICSSHKLVPISSSVVPKYVSFDLNLFQFKLK